MTNDRTPHIRVSPLLFTLLILFGANQPLCASELRMTPMVRAVAEARPSVVNIHGKKTVRTVPEHIGETSTYRHVNGMGTGVVIDERGYVITNYHVVEGVRQIQATLADKSVVSANLVAHDPSTDLAVIKLNTSKRMPVIRIGTSSDLMPAEPVVAVGNAYGYVHTVTRGIISELERAVQVSDDQTYKDLIQTDASINPGNSGGPLLNIDGEMIGINVAVRVGAQGIGFAIPVDQAMEVAARLIRSEQRLTIAHGVVGRTKLTDRKPDYIVDNVKDASPAAKAGLKPGDAISKLGDVKVERALDFERALLDRNNGDKVQLQVNRAGETLLMEMTLTGTPKVENLTTDDRIWKEIGCRLSIIPDQQFQLYNTRYRGGLKVDGVREGGPAAKQGIQAGDVLVGLHLWETISIDNIAYILNRPDFDDIQPMKFYILRGDETLYGHMRVSRVNAR